MIPTSLKLKVCKTFILWDVRHVDVFLCFQTIYVAQTKMCGNKNVITTFQSIDVGRCNCLAEKGAHADCISGSKGFLSLRAECYYETEGCDVTQATYSVEPGVLGSFSAEGNQRSPLWAPLLARRYIVSPLIMVHRKTIVRSATDQQVA